MLKVKVANRTYGMSRKEYEGLLGIASEQVPFGIYAVEKKDYAELLNTKCKSVTQLKKLKEDISHKDIKCIQMRDRYG